MILWWYQMLCSKASNEGSSCTILIGLCHGLSEVNDRASVQAQCIWPQSYESNEPRLGKSRKPWQDVVKEQDDNDYVNFPMIHINITELFHVSLKQLPIRSSEFQIHPITKTILSCIWLGNKLIFLKELR